MSIEILLFVALIAGGAGVVLTLLALGRGRGDGGDDAAAEVSGDAPPRARPGAGPCRGWFLPGGRRLGNLRYARHREALEAMAADLSESDDIDLAIGAKKKVLAKLRRLPWPEDEARFVADPADPFLLLLDRPLEVFDPRYDRYLIVPLGFMEAAGGLEAFLGALTYDVLANRKNPMDVGERLLKDAAEAALASGFAPPDILRAVVEMLRRQVFAGRYRPFVAMPALVPGARRGRAKSPAPEPTPPAAGTSPGRPVPAPGAGPAPTSGVETPAPGPISAAAPPLQTPAAPAPLKGSRKPKK